MNYHRLVVALALKGLLLTVAVSAVAEPRILIGPTESDEEPEAVETISGLTFDQLRRLRELRKWLEKRQVIRQQIELQRAETGLSGSLFTDRQLLAPLGQRYSRVLPVSPEPSGPSGLVLPPLPDFGDGARSPNRGGSDAQPVTGGVDESAETDSVSPGRRVTHMTMPPASGAEDAPQIEYEIHPVR